MLSKRVFELLDKTAKGVRNSDLPFGGIQVVFSGDFFQLPPISEGRDCGSFCFKSETWDLLFGKNQFELTTNFRQQDDNAYYSILSDIRNGRISQKTKKQLERRVDVFPEGEIRPTELYPTRAKVNRINEGFNSELTTKEHVFTSMVANKTTGAILDVEKQNSIVKCNTVASFRDSTLRLKIGSQVICTANVDMHSKNKIVNGSTGIVIDFSEGGFPIVRFHNGRKMEVTQHSIDFEAFGQRYTHMSIPLNLSWALSIHKSQGCSLDFAIVDCGEDIFEAGQIYVALSRIKKLEGLFLRGLDFSKLLIKKSVLQFYEKLRQIDRDLIHKIGKK